MTGFHKNGARCAAILALGAVAMMSEAAAQPLSPPAIQRQTSASILAGARAASTAANLPSPSETLYLRRRSDYASEAEMIEREIAIVVAETQTLRAFNRDLEKDVAASANKARRSNEERLAAKKRRLAALRRKLETDRKRVLERLNATEGELRTTRHLRGQAAEKKLKRERELWRQREQELQQERDRLRGLLERVSELAANVG